MRHEETIKTCSVEGCVNEAHEALLCKRHSAYYVKTSQVDIGTDQTLNTTATTEALQPPNCRLAPTYLHLLTKMLTDDNSDIIEWSSNGHIEVHHPDRLEKKFWYDISTAQSRAHSKVK